MAVIETKVTAIQEDMHDLKVSHEKFIDAANKTYATKKEVEAVRSDFKDHANGSRDWIKWTVVIGLTLVSIALSLFR